VVEMVMGTAAEISAGLDFGPSRNGELHGAKGVPVPTA
jgi:hypothetical protein